MAGGIITATTESVSSNHQMHSYRYQFDHEPGTRDVRPALDATFKNLFAEVETAPGAGNAWRMRYVQVGVGSIIEAVISDSATTAQNTSDSAAVLRGSQMLMDIQVDAGAPAATRAKGFVGIE